MIDIESSSFLQPSRFAELSRRSLEAVKEQLNVYYPRDRPSEEMPETLLHEFKGNLKDSIVNLEPKTDGSSVIAVDVSCRTLGETRYGQIEALRGSIVWREEGTYRYLRYGPYVICVRRDRPPGSSGSDLLQLQYEIESEIRARICEFASNSIVLFDGCLCDFGQPAHGPTLSTILHLGRKNSNAVMAITKQSVALESLGGALVKVDRTPGPILLNLTCRDDLSFRQLGWIFLAKLARKSLPFRLDIDKALCWEEARHSVERLLGNDIMAQGYPETLRLAHILSILTASEVIVLQSQMAKHYGLIAEKSTNVRRLLFGPYGKWGDS